jgi:probable HAF family extracellular repeat protein
MNARLQLGFLISFALASVATAQEYTVTVLPTLGGGLDESRALGVSDSGYVTGVDFTAGQGFLYRNGTITSLGIGVGYSVGHSVNASGEVAGQAAASPQVQAFFSHAVLYQHGNLLDIGYPGGNSMALGINNAGTVVGQTTTGGSTPFQPFMYKNGVLTLLSWQGAATAINNRGEIVGEEYSNTNAGISYAVAYQNGVLTNLGIQGAATGVSDNGLIVGLGVANGLATAFLERNGQIVNLGALPGGGGDTFGFAVNNAGEVVGDSGVHAFLYRNGQMIDLNSLISPNLGIVVQDARDINNQGWIVGDALNLNTGLPEAVLLTPNDPLLTPNDPRKSSGVPEPATLGLLGFSIAVLMMGHRRKSRTLTVS